jgi:hypothetical protein
MPLIYYNNIFLKPVNKRMYKRIYKRLNQVKLRIYYLSLIF